MFLIVFLYVYWFTVEKKWDKKFFRYSVLYAFIFAIVVLPFALPLLTGSSELTYNRDVAATAWFGSDLGAMFVPSPMHWLVGDWVKPLYGNTSLQKSFAFSAMTAFYIGLIVILCLPSL